MSTHSLVHHPVTLLLQHSQLSLRVHACTICQYTHTNTQTHTHTHTPVYTYITTLGMYINTYEHTLSRATSCCPPPAL